MSLVLLLGQRLLEQRHLGFELVDYLSLLLQSPPQQPLFMLVIQRLPFFPLLDYESSSAARCVQNLTIFKSLGEVIHLDYAACNYYASSHFSACQPSLVTIANSLSFTFYGCKSTTSSQNHSGHTDLTDVDGPGLRLRYYSVSLRASRPT